MALGDRDGVASFDKISPTAKLVAYLRTFTDIPYAKEIAQESGAEAVYREIQGEGAERTVRLAPFWEARYKLTNRILKERSAKQVLEIAAGLSPRGLEMTRDPEVVYVSSDLKEMLETERRIAEKILASEGPRPNLHFAVANALEMGSISRAIAPFTHARPVAVVTEGLIPYLDRRERPVLASNIGQVLSEFGGIWIASDVRTKQSFRAAAQFDRTARRRAERISGLVDRNIAENLFEDEADLKHFFLDAGFDAEDYAYAGLLEDLASVVALKLDTGEMQRVRRAFENTKTLVLTRSGGASRV